MSNISDKLTLTPVVAPNLTSSDYGKDVKEQFDVIDSNFRKLGNYDFVKGEHGADLGLEKLKIFNDGKTTLTEFGAAVVNAILKRSDITPNTSIKDIVLGSGEAKNILEYNWYDYLLSEDKTHGDDSTSLVSVFYREVNQLLEDSTREYVGSPLPFIFIDARFCSDSIRNVSSQTLEYDLFRDAVDKSCALYVRYDENGWRIERIAQFPTLYYDDRMFKWKIFERESGIIAQGVEGLEGRAGRVWMAIVEANDLKDSNSTYLKVQAVMRFHNTYDSHVEWMTPEAATDKLNGGLTEGDAVIAIPRVDITNHHNVDSKGNVTITYEKDNYPAGSNVIWFTVIQTRTNTSNEKEYVVYYSKDCEVEMNIGKTWMLETMKYIGSYDSTLKGLFLRMYPNASDTETTKNTRAHIIYTDTTSEDPEEMNIMRVRPVMDYTTPRTSAKGTTVLGSPTRLIVDDFDSVYVGGSNASYIGSRPNNQYYSKDTFVLASEHIYGKADSVDIESLTNDLTLRGAQHNILYGGPDDTYKEYDNAIEKLRKDMTKDEWEHSLGYTIDTYSKSRGIKIESHTYVRPGRILWANDSKISNLWVKHGSYIGVADEAYFEKQYIPGGQILRLSPNNIQSSDLSTSTKSGVLGINRKNGGDVEICTNNNDEIRTYGLLTAKQDATFERNVSVKGKTTLYNTTIEGSGFSPVHIGSVASGAIKDVIQRNWPSNVSEESTTGISVKSEEEKTVGNFSIESTKKVTSHATSAKVKIDKQMDVYIRRDDNWTCSGSKLISSVVCDFTLNVCLVGSKTGTHLLKQVTGTDTCNISIPVYATKTAWNHVSFTIPKKEYTVSGLEIGEELSIVVSVVTSTYANASGKTGDCWINGGTKTNLKPGNNEFTIEQYPNQSGFKDIKTVVAGGTVMLGLSRHRNICLYVDGRSDAEAAKSSSKSSLTNIEKNALCGIGFAYTDKDGVERMKLIPIRDIYKGIYGVELEDNTSSEKL